MIKSSPKIKKTMLEICVEKKKQFFKVLYEAIEDGFEVINNSEMIFSIKDNRENWEAVRNFITNVTDTNG